MTDIQLFFKTSWFHQYLFEWQQLNLYMLLRAAVSFRWLYIVEMLKQTISCLLQNDLSNIQGLLYMSLLKGFERLPLRGLTWLIPSTYAFDVLYGYIYLISPPKAHLKMIFLFPRWGMLVSWTVRSKPSYFSINLSIFSKCFSTKTSGPDCRDSRSSHLQS